MDVDFPALVLATTIAAVVATALILAHRGDDNRRGWIVAAALAAVLLALGSADLLRQSPREMHITTVLIGGSLPVLGALGMVRGTRRVHLWVRWMMVFATALVLLFGGLLIGAAVLPRFLTSLRLDAGTVTAVLFSHESFGASDRSPGGRDERS